jgi:hypothetical protein
MSEMKISYLDMLEKLKREDYFKTEEEKGLLLYLINNEYSHMEHMIKLLRYKPSSGNTELDKFLSGRVQLNFYEKGRSDSFFIGHFKQDFFDKYPVLLVHFLN